ncbi:MULTISPECIES: VWA domain-containing protein [Mycobacteriaceae]|uniref:VWA domain-containing protein n=1 Tax=Mycobacteriaceae TaxID=1762 RepID=UPI0010621ED7|nr:MULTISPECIES: VWA domain-containing protein [Mycobacteriaceae]MBB3748680.1 Ca-activated chloride channel family protein [Mycolicibacterium sp. BK634]
MTVPGIGSLTLAGLAHPSLLLLALVPVALIALYAVMQIQRRRRLRQFSDPTALGRLAPKRPHRLRHLPIALAALALLLLVFALAGPTHQARIPRNRAVVMLVIDVSQSMQAKDVPPTRLRAAQDAAKTFAQQLTPGVNLGLVSFGGNVNLLVSPTPDHGATVTALDKLQPDNSTATGEALFTALESIQTVSTVLSAGDATPPPARIVLLSDGGENKPANPDNPRGAYTAARAAKDQGVPVSTITFGTQGGVVTLKDDTIPVPSDDRQMKRIAELSGGQSYRATNIDELNKSYGSVLQQVGYQTISAPAGTAWLRLAVLVATIAVFLGLAVNRNLPA